MCLVLIRVLAPSDYIATCYLSLLVASAGAILLDKDSDVYINGITIFSNNRAGDDGGKIFKVRGSYCFQKARIGETPNG